MFPALLAHLQGVQSVRPKHVTVSSVHNVIVSLMLLYVFVGSNCSNGIVMHGMENH